MKNILLSMMLFVGVAFGQLTTYPASASATFDVSTGAPVVVELAVQNTGTQGVFWTWSNAPTPSPNIDVQPRNGFLSAGSSQVVRVFINSAVGIPFGSFVAPIEFSSYTSNSSERVATSFEVHFNVIDSRTYVTPQDYVIPHIASGGGWSTTVNLTNTTDTVSLVQLKFFNTSGTNDFFTVNGSSVSSYSVVVPANGTASFKMNEPVGTKSGTIVATPVYGQPVNISAIYDNGLFEVSVLGVVPNKRQLNIPFNNTGDNVTSVAFANFLNYQQRVRVSMFDDFGYMFHTNSVELGPFAQTSFSTVVAFPSSVGRSGTLRLDTQQNGLAGFGLKFNLRKNFHISVPTF